MKTDVSHSPSPGKIVLPVAVHRKSLRSGRREERTEPSLPSGVPRSGRGSRTVRRPRRFRRSVAPPRGCRRRRSALQLQRRPERSRLTPCESFRVRQNCENGLFSQAFIQSVDEFSCVTSVAPCV